MHGAFEGIFVAKMEGVRTMFHYYRCYHVADLCTKRTSVLNDALAALGPVAGNGCHNMWFFRTGELRVKLIKEKMCLFVIKPACLTASTKDAIGHD